MLFLYSVLPSLFLARITVSFFFPNDDDSRWTSKGITNKVQPVHPLSWKASEFCPGTFSITLLSLLLLLKGEEEAVAVIIIIVSSELKSYSMWL